MKKPRSTAREVYGILNPYGDVWTTETFDTEEAARKHVRDFWHSMPDGYRIVRARVRVSYIGEVDAGRTALSARGSTE